MDSSDDEAESAWLRAELVAANQTISDMRDRITHLTGVIHLHEEQLKYFNGP